MKCHPKCLQPHAERISAKWPYYDNCVKLCWMEISCLLEEMVGTRVPWPSWGTGGMGTRIQEQGLASGALPMALPSWELLALGLGTCCSTDSGCCTVGAWHGDAVIHMQPQGLLTCCAKLSIHIPS